ncbi:MULTISPECIES: VOC family protein [unclassified Kribbella]|uniref:VOC family protein n=1 Tax=unclassified Kribbella TaxID=2644121 RepID=UPI00301784EF
MKFTKTIVYVEDAEASIAFFERAFGWKGTYWGNGSGEVDAGETKIVFATYAVGQSHLTAIGAPGAVGFEIAFTSEDVEGDFRRAVEAGADPLKEPEKSPWGQVTSYLRCPDGTVIDLASPA